MKRVLINSEDDSYDTLFRGWDIIRSPTSLSPSIPWEDIDLLLLVGDVSDVDPAFYQEGNKGSRNINRLQDYEAFSFITKSRRFTIPIVGICKGAQQLCISHRGRLIQDVPRVGDHRVSLCNDDSEPPRGYYVPADHHQVMVPPESAVIHAVNETKGYPEVVTYPNTLDLSIQYHPEWAPEGSKARSSFFNAVEDLTNGNIRFSS